MNHKNLNQELLDFIQGSPSCYHVIANLAAELDARGYMALRETDHWDLQAGGRYYVTRNASSLIAFRLPSETGGGDQTMDTGACSAPYRIMASHSDSPVFKIKYAPELESAGQYLRLNVEKYGGMLCAPWFDRPLSVAGRVLVAEEGSIVQKLVNIDRDLLMLPSLAIHMNRDANDGVKYNAQQDMLPLFGDITEKGAFEKLIAEEAGVSGEAVLGSDLFVYPRTAPSIWGLRTSISPPQDWMIWNAGIRHSGAFWKVKTVPGNMRCPGGERRGSLCRSMPSSTMRKWAVAPDRGQRPPSCPIRWNASARAGAHPQGIINAPLPAVS